MSHKNSQQEISRRGFSLIEVVVGSALFLVVAIAAYSAYTSLFQVARANQTKLLALALASEQLEIVRGMSYIDVGLVDGIPHGILSARQEVVRGGVPFTVALYIRDENAQSPFSTGGTIVSKLVEVSVSCASCKNFTPIVLTGEVTPTSI
ncbi:MAG: prepilin-type N-terminal cleavage/methylation domain-containing protein [Candidatus Taylorbacteria bacterium]